MPADYRILAAQGLAYVKFSGHVAMDEVATCLAAFAADPNSQHAHRHLVDFSTVSSFDSNFVKILEMQAKMASVFTGNAAQWIFAYYAPSHTGRQMANYGIRAWSGVENVVIRMTTTESDTCDVLGLPGRSLAKLLNGVSPP